MLLMAYQADKLKEVRRRKRAKLPLHGRPKRLETLKKAIRGLKVELG